MQATSLLKNEEGSVLVLSLILLVLLTIMGISATSTSTIEVQIAGNGARAKQNLYLAEAAAMEAVQMMEEETDPDNFKPDSENTNGMNEDLSDISQANKKNAAVSAAGARPQYAVVARGITETSSLGITTPTQLYTFDVYGIYDGNGLSQVVVGYKKRF